MTKAMKPKIWDVCNRKYLGAIGVAIKNILRLWYKKMRAMKLVEFQSYEDCWNFDKNVKVLNKAIHEKTKQNGLKASLQKNKIRTTAERALLPLVPHLSKIRVILLP